MLTGVQTCRPRENFPRVANVLPSAGAADCRITLNGLTMRTQGRRMGRSELLLLVGGFAALCSSKSTNDGRLLSNDHDHDHGSGPQEAPPDMEAMQEGKGGEQLSDGVVVGIVFAIVAFFVIAVLIARQLIDAKTVKAWNLPFSGGQASFWGGMPEGEGADKPAVELKRLSRASALELTSCLFRSPIHEGQKAPKACLAAEDHVGDREIGSRCLSLEVHEARMPPLALEEARICRVVS